MYTVKQAAEILELNPHTIRFYTDNNLIPGLKRGKNNVRMFDEETMNWLKGVKNLRTAGMSVKAVKKYVDLCLIGESALPERVEIVHEQRKKVNEEIKKLQKSRSYLDDKLELYHNMQQGTETLDKTNPAEWEK